MTRKYSEGVIDTRLSDRQTIAAAGGKKKCLVRLVMCTCIQIAIARPKRDYCGLNEGGYSTYRQRYFVKLGGREDTEK